jgi:transposase
MINFKKKLSRNVKIRAKTMRGGNKSKKQNKKQNKKQSKKQNKNWTSALTAANIELEKTGSYKQARIKLRSQALKNATAIFGAVGDGRM